MSRLWFIRIVKDSKQITMVWTDISRPRYQRVDTRCPSDCLDEEWALIEPFLPAPKRVGRPRTTKLRAVWDASQYRASSGCQRAMIANDFPPPSTVQRYFYDWQDSGLFHRIHHALVMGAREVEGHEASPTAGVIDSQSDKATESGGVCGYDAGKKVKGRKRHIVTDTNGFMVGLVVHSAGIQDRDAASIVLKSIRDTHPWLRHVFADGGYGGPKLRGAVEKIGCSTMEIVKRSDTATGFEVIPRRWVVEGTFAWLGHCRRLATDWEKSIQSAESWLLVAHIKIVTRRIARLSNH